MTGPDAAGGVLRRSHLAVLLAAVALIGLAVGWKATRRYDAPVAPQSALVRQAPLFQLHDHSMKLVRLGRYAGRQKLLVAFFDASDGLERSTLAAALRDRFPEFDRTGGVVIGVTAARPAENRAAIERIGNWPFMVLSDLNAYEIHRAWGAWDERAEKPLEAVFIVDRAGLIRFSHIGQKQLTAPEAWVQELGRVR